MDELLHSNCRQCNHYLATKYHFWLFYLLLTNDKLDRYLFVQSHPCFNKTPGQFVPKVVNSSTVDYSTSLTVVSETLHETPIVFSSLSFSFPLKHFLRTLIFTKTCKKEVVTRPVAA